MLSRTNSFVSLGILLAATLFPLGATAQGSPPNQPAQSKAQSPKPTEANKVPLTKPAKTAVAQPSKSSSPKPSDPATISARAAAISKTSATQPAKPATTKTVDKPVAAAKSGDTKSATAKPVDIKADQSNKATTSAKADSKKDGVGKTGGVPKTASTKAEVSKKEPSRSERKEARRSERPGVGLVPPPPPETPTVLGPYGSVGSMEQLVSLELLSVDSLKTRRKELSSQLDVAQAHLKEKQAQLSDQSGRGKQFKELYDEGVISKRELETALEDSKEYQAAIDAEKLKISDFQQAINRVDSKLKAVSRIGGRKTASAKGKVKAQAAYSEHKSLAKANAVSSPDIGSVVSQTASSAPQSAKQVSPITASPTATAPASPPQATNSPQNTESVPKASQSTNAPSTNAAQPDDMQTEGEGGQIPVTVPISR